MPIWKTIPIHEQPELTLTDWRIFETPEGSRHFNGYCFGNREGRVSSAIVDFDDEKNVGRTRSGRVYSLEGNRGRDGDADYVLGRWLAINGFTWEEIIFV